MATASNPSAHRPARRRIFWWGLTAFLALILALPLTGYLYVELLQPAYAQQTGAEVNPRADYWRQARTGNQGYTAASGPYTTSELIQNGGQIWRQARNGPVTTYGAGILAVAVVVLVGFFALRRNIRIEEGFSNRVIPRWSVAARVLHWYVAILFILLALTGLSLMYGRAVLIPWLGLEGFAAYAQLAMTTHNYLGPAFIVGLLVMIVWWIKDNLPRAYDWEWLKMGGGLFKRGAHAPAGRNNAGEKILFWILATVGLAVAITGLILDFPNFAQTRETMQIANVLHAAGATIWTAVILGHIYLGTIGQEGTWESMAHGHVDVNWARQHANVWYDEQKDNAIPRPETPAGGTAHEQPSS
jgi:formate dehydrogenase subunit gamma